jgi:hypothetical protein
MSAITVSIAPHMNADPKTIIVKLSKSSISYPLIVGRPWPWLDCSCRFGKVFGILLRVGLQAVQERGGLAGRTCCAHNQPLVTLESLEP